MAACEATVVERRNSTRASIRASTGTSVTSTSGAGLERQHVSMLVMVMIGAVIFSAFKSAWQVISAGTRPRSEHSEWLHDNQLSSYEAHFAELGLVTLVDYAQLEGVRLSALPARDRERLQRASRILRQQLLLRQWLHEHHLNHHARRSCHFALFCKSSRLSQLGISSLEDVYWLEDARAEAALGKDLGPWSSARQSLPTSKSDLEALKAQLWIRLQHHNDQLKAPWTWGGMLVVSVSMAGLVALATMTQPVLAPETKSTLLRYVTGKYLLPNNCQVHFDWQEPKIVGDTMTFTVKFFQRNGRPYPICDRDNFLVEITQGCHKVAVATELGATDPAMANAAVIKFTVRRAGQYRISVLVANQHIRGSPFLKSFLPGPPDPNKTVLVRHNSTVVCTAGVSHSLQIEPRDEYNNLCCARDAEPEDEEEEGDEERESPTDGYELSVWRMGLPEPQPGSNLPTCLSYHPDSHRLGMVLKMEQEGCYRARLTYKGTTLSNGDFDIIVLSGSEASLVQRNIATKSHNIYHEARLVAIQGERLAKPKKVYVYISPKQLTIKEYLFKLIPKRLLTFRLCPSTKFSFPSGNGSSQASLVVDDGCQPKVELATGERNVIAATFTHFLLKNIGGSETFKDKQDFFYHEVRKHHQKHYHDKLPVEVNRDTLLESSMKTTKRFSVGDWCKNFEITFQGEQGLDWGGVRREWFELICASLFDPMRGSLFTSFVDSKQALVHPNSRRPPLLKLKHYEFAGKVVGKCLYESALGGTYRQLVRARFTRSFLAQLIGLRVHYKYFEQDDPDLYLTKVKYILEHDVDDMDLFFVEEEYDRCGRLLKVVELVPGGAKVRVTNQSKYQYLDVLAQYRLANSVREEVEAFLKGLNEIIPDNLLSIFDENELELLMCGTGEYSIADLKAHHVASGSSYEFRKVLDWFWTAVSNFTEEEMARLLQFTTGCSQLPPGGFSQLSPKFQLTAAPTFGNLPTAHTCFNQLCLPDYENYEQFEKALLLAINEGTEGFGLV